MYCHGASGIVQSRSTQFNFRALRNKEKSKPPSCFVLMSVVYKQKCLFETRCLTVSLRKLTYPRSSSAGPHHVRMQNEHHPGGGGTLGISGWGCVARSVEPLRPVQTLATCWAQQCCVLLANNFASVCTGL